MTEPLLKRTLSRFRTRTDPRPRDVPPAAPPSPGSGLVVIRTLDPTCDHTPLCSSSNPGPSPGPGLGTRPSLGPGFSPGPGPGPSPGPVSVWVPRSPRRRAYLQSLDSSSRAWVLSSGKSPAPVQIQVRPRAPVVPGAPGEGQIWYNPIPEEDSAPEETRASDREGADPEQSPAPSEPTGGVSGGVSERVMDRLRSPALKLRRKLSLKSRRDRHGNSSQDTPPTNQDTPPQDCSSPCRKRPIRRQLSGRRGCHSNNGELQGTSQQGEEPRPQSPAHSVTGVLTVHLQGLEQLTHRTSGEVVPRPQKMGVPGGVSRCVSVVIQVDDVIRARTAAMTMTGLSLHLDHAFHLPLERAQSMKVLVLSRVSPDPEVKTCSRARLCAVGGVCLPSLFSGPQSQDLSLDLEPRGSLLLRLSLQAGEEAVGGAQVFGVELRDLVQRESSEKPVPLILQKTVSEINKRGLKVEGIYRLCGSSSVKKQLRDEFDSSSSSVDLRTCPDLHAISGVLKDYLRELPSPLITASLYDAIQDVMTSDPCVAPDPVQLLQCLPLVHRETLSFLMDHLSLVASRSSFNKMNAQNLAVCFGPVLFAAVQTDQWERSVAGRGGARSKADQSGSGVDFKQHIEALHFLLQHWPVPPPQLSPGAVGGARESSPEAVGGARCRWRDRCRHRQAGDWSRYQDTPTERVEEEPVLDFEAPFNCRLSLKDFDLLIQDFHRQLSKV